MAMDSPREIVIGPTRMRTSGSRKSEQLSSLEAWSSSPLPLVPLVPTQLVLLDSPDASAAVASAAAVTGRVVLCFARASWSSESMSQPAARGCARAQSAASRRS